MPLEPSIVVKIEGKAIQNKIRIMFLCVHYGINQIAEANIRIKDGNISSEKFSVAALPEMSPGKKVQVLAGWERGKESLIFQGLITEKRIGCENEILYLELGCHAEAIKMVDTPITQLFDQDTKDSDLLKKLLKDAGITMGSIQNSSIKHTQFLQYGMPAWNCLLQRVFANGFVFLPTPNKSIIADPLKHKGGEYNLTLSQSGVIDFDIGVDISSQIDSASTSAWDIKNQDQTVAVKVSENSSTKFKNAGTILGKKNWSVNSNLPLSKEEIQAWSKSEVTYRKLDLYKGMICCEVTLKNRLAKISVGDSVKLDGFSDDFSGAFWVTGIHHEVTSSGWNVKIKIGQSQTTTNRQFNVSRDDQRHLSALPYINSGLAIGVVAKFKEDPEKLHRIPVYLPGASSNKPVWARLATPFAGKREGFHFPPGEKDEVLIGFWQGDFRQPIILGSLHNPVNLPPQSYGQSRAKRGILFKKDFTSLVIDSEGSGDNEKIKRILISAAEDMGVVVGEKGEISISNDKNSVVLNNSLSIESKEGAVVKTTGELKLESGKKCAITAASGTEVE